MSEEQLEYSAKLLADNISLEKRNKEIYEGFIATTQELCEATKEVERLNNIINLMSDFLVKHIANGGLDFMYRQGFKDSYKKLQELKGSDTRE